MVCSSSVAALPMLTFLTGAFTELLTLKTIAEQRVEPTSDLRTPKNSDCELSFAV